MKYIYPRRPSRKGNMDEEPKIATSFSLTKVRSFPWFSKRRGISLLDSLYTANQNNWPLCILALVLLAIYIIQMTWMSTLESNLFLENSGKKRSCYEHKSPLHWLTEHLVFTGLAWPSTFKIVVLPVGQPSHSWQYATLLLKSSLEILPGLSWSWDPGIVVFRGVNKNRFLIYFN